jgi:transcription-repair coupling factor (superfamily II helicase)
LSDLASEFSDRFGRPPPEVENLLYIVRLKALAARAGIESISTEPGQVTLRLFGGMLISRDGMKVGLTQIRLNLKRLGSEWQKVLEEVVGRIS